MYSVGDWTQFVNKLQIVENQRGRTFIACPADCQFFNVKSVETVEGGGAYSSTYWETRDAQEIRFRHAKEIR